MIKCDAMPKMLRFFKRTLIKLVSACV